MIIGGALVGLTEDIKERPIIMSGDNPKLILEGRKTQTRRIVTKRFGTRGHARVAVDPVTWDFGQIINGDAYFHYAAGGTSHSSGPAPLVLPCPYGVAGDRLWVRETWAIKDCGHRVSIKKGSVAGRLADEAIAASGNG